jgi:hypothetical protein
MIRSKAIVGPRLDGDFDMLSLTRHLPPREDRHDARPAQRKIGTARALQDGDKPSSLNCVGRDHGNKT